MNAISFSPQVSYYAVLILLVKMWDDKTRTWWDAGGWGDTGWCRCCDLVLGTSTVRRVIGSRRLWIWGPSWEGWSWLVQDLITPLIMACNLNLWIAYFWISHSMYSDHGVTETTHKGGYCDGSEGVPVLRLGIKMLYNLWPCSWPKVACWKMGGRLSPHWGRPAHSGGSLLATGTWVQKNYPAESRPNC